MKRGIERSPVFSASTSSHNVVASGPKVFMPTATPTNLSTRWWPQPELAAITLIVVAIYFTRMTDLPIAGEETRWARGAQQMLETGDWVVLRQQGQVFPERPPLSSWAMAAVGMIRGRVDDVAVRLPSVTAVLLTCYVIVLYGRHFLSRFGGLAAASIYATTAQVMEIGRMGESEAIFTFLLASALLLWHLGYVSGWRAVVVWSVGYTFAALAGLAKGPQGPIYFCAATGAYLLVHRQWRYLLSPAHAFGVTLFVLVVGAWQVPYYLATDIHSVVATWSGLAGDRFQAVGLIAHLAAYPLEIFACLLPWSPLLVALARPRFRESIRAAWPMVAFLSLALVVTFPTVWFAVGARGRYYMPLYPCFCLLIGLVVDRSSTAATQSVLRTDWTRFARVSGVLAAAAGWMILAVSLFPGLGMGPVQQPVGVAIVFAGCMTLLAAVVLASTRAVTRFHFNTGFLTLCLMFGIWSTGPVLNIQISRWNNPAPDVALLRERIPESHRLVSFTAIDHRFAYFYESQIAELEWPNSADDVPAEVEYFCLNRFSSDTPERRAAGRGRTWYTTPGTLPFKWEEVATINCERYRKDRPHRVVVVGRRIPEKMVAEAEVPAPTASSRR